MEISDVADQTFRVSTVGELDVNRNARPAVIIFLCASFGLAGPTEPCCDTRAGGNCLKSLYSSFILTDNRILVLLLGRLVCVLRPRSDEPLFVVPDVIVRT